MIHIRLYIFSFFSAFVLFACNSNSDQKASQTDSIVVVKDSAAKEPENTVYEDCYEQFFKGLPRLDDSDNVMLTLKSGNKVKFKDFMGEDMGGKYARYGLKSIDNDTIPELILYNYTGGAHCCDEIYIFAKEKKGYRVRARLYGGFVCIDSATNIFTFSFNETLGYFFGCYACGFSDSAKGFQTIREIDLRYANGRLELKPYDSSTAKQLIRNLEILKEHGYEEMQDGLMDSGWRKEFAMNFAVWHFNNGKNWNATKKLFDQYYTFKDAARVWKELYSSLKDAGKESSI